VLLEDYFEEEEEEKGGGGGGRRTKVVATVTAVRSLSRSRHNKTLASGISPLLCHLLFSWPKKGHSVQVRQMWCGPVHGALFCIISHKSKFVIYHPHCEYCVL